MTRRADTAWWSLLIGGGLTALASLLHVAIILSGPSWYRFFGAGERMARLASRGAVYPTVLTAAIAVVLGIWSLYAYSGAGLIRRLPLLRPTLAAIAAVYFIRGIIGVPAVLLIDTPYALELRARPVFMLSTSLICCALGSCYAAGALAPRSKVRNVSSI